MFELLDAAFVRNAREQGASYTSIANHYKSLYPTVGVNRKNIATFCQIHNIHKQTDVSDEERTLKAFLTSKITKVIVLRPFLLTLELNSLFWQNSQNGMFCK